MHVMRVVCFGAIAFASYAADVDRAVTIVLVEHDLIVDFQVRVSGLAEPMRVAAS